MAILILGLVVFLATHSIRIVADDWRARQVARLGLRTYKNLYSVVALVGFVLIVWGYGLARTEPVVIWSPPVWTRHVAALLTLPAFILLAAASPRGNFLKAAVGHPMVLGVALWAFAHLLANRMLADVCSSAPSWSGRLRILRRRAGATSGKARFTRAVLPRAMQWP